MKRIKRSDMHLSKPAERRELQLICNDAIDWELEQGRLRRPCSVRNLRRWLRREVIKREGLSAGRQRLMKAAAIILLISGMIFAGPV